MQNSNSITSTIIEKATLTLFPGVELVVTPEGTADYLEMRTAQLSSLNHLLTSGDFEGWDDTIKADAKWLAATLAAEVSKLVSVVTFGDNFKNNS